MPTLSDVKHWAKPDEEVFIIVIRREDTNIPEEHWDEFVDNATMNGAVWETALESLERDYEEIWKVDNEEQEDEEDE